MNKNEKLDIFKNENFLCKQDVVNSFETFIEHHRENDNEEGYSEGKLSVLLELCGKFQQALDSCKLPDLTDDWWFYQYEITSDSIDLTLNYCNEFEFSEGGEPETMTSTKEFVLLNVKCDYLTVEQYANLYGVTTTTIRQWIRRGKLRTAKKMGRDWLIPALADKPTRGFQSASYNWTYLPQPIRDEFPFLKEYNTIYIYQDSDKSKFQCIMGWPGSDNRYCITLSATEREKLELALISSNCVNVEDTSNSIMFVPSK